MKKMIDLLDSLKGFELAFFSALLLGFQFVLVTIAPQPHELSLYLSALCMSLLCAMLVIKISRDLRDWWNARSKR